MRSWARKFFACVANASTEAQLADARLQIADLEDLVADQSDLIERLSETFQAADHFLNVLKTRNAEGSHLISFEIDGDERLTAILHNAIWNLESKTCGIPAAPPFNLKGTTH